MNRDHRKSLLMASTAVALAITLSPAVLTAQSALAKGAKPKFTVLYSFQGGTTDGVGPNALLMDTAGNLYGTTVVGGTDDYGTVFKLDTSGHETVLYNFRGGADGEEPAAGVIMDSNGNLYGTTQYGGPYSGGIAFKIDISGNETILHRFGNQSTGDGANPIAALIFDKSGNLYGTTNYGGTNNDGTVFKLNSKGKETILWNMNWPGPAFPFGGLTWGPGGLLYGTTSQGYGGNGNDGVVFELNPANGQNSILYGFNGYPDGSYSEAGLIRDQAGNFYGTTESGGSHCAPYGCGAVFKVTKAGKETLLHSFNDTGTDGNQPTAGVVRDKAGNLYGTTPWGNSLGWGTVFKLDSAGKETVLYTFTGGTDGKYPQSGVILGKDGNLYGTSAQGGDPSTCSGLGCGTVWKLTP